MMRPFGAAMRTRLFGVVYLGYFVTAILGQLSVSRAGISELGAGPRDASTVANGVLAHEGALRLGFALTMVSIAAYVVVIALFHQLFQAVSRFRAGLAACFGLVGMALQAGAVAAQLAAVATIGGGDQVRALAPVLLDVARQSDGVGLVFDGLFLLLIGDLIIRSRLVPRVLGVLFALAGLGWLTFLAPTLTASALPVVEVVGVVAEGSLMLWMLVVGVRGVSRTGGA